MNYELIIVLYESSEFEKPKQQQNKWPEFEINKSNNNKNPLQKTILTSVKMFCSW